MSSWSNYELEAIQLAQQAATHYLESLEDRKSVFPTKDAIAKLSVFDEPLPANSMEPTEVIRLLDQVGSPATTAQMGGRYFGFVNGGSLPVSLAARQLAGAWDQNAALHVMSPIAAKLEAVAEAWIVDLLELPQGTAMGLLTGTSLSLACGFVAARNELLQRQGWNVHAHGLFGAPTIRVVAGEAAHGTVWKALSFIGLGRDRVEKVPCDSQGRILAGDLPPLDANTLLILSAGNVNTGAFDNFQEILPVAVAAKAWVHVDGAFGLWAACAKATRRLTQGVELADSWSCDAHKTLNTPYDCGLILCKDRKALVNAMQASGSYMQWSDSLDARDNMMYSPDMSRRARSIELWAALKSLGRQGVDDLITQLHERAKEFASSLEKVGYVVENEVVFNQVAVRLDSDQATLEALSKIQESSECWVGGSALNGRKIIRVSVSSYRTTEQDVERSVEAFARAAKEVGDSS